MFGEGLERYVVFVFADRRANEGPVVVTILWILGVALALAACVLFYGVFIERYLVRFPRRRIEVPGLPEAYRGVRLAHISDMHLGPLVPACFLERLLRKVARLAPDIIVTTGDNVLGRQVPDRVDAAWDLLCTLHAPLGVFSVLGNCDHRADRDRSLGRLRESGQDLRGRARMIEKDGQRLIVPMRYQCRLPGWNEATERKYPGTYNARRDKLEQSWGKLFGSSNSSSPRGRRNASRMALGILVHWPSSRFSQNSSENRFRLMTAPHSRRKR